MTLFVVFCPEMVECRWGGCSWYKCGAVVLEIGLFNESAGSSIGDQEWYRNFISNEKRNLARLQRAFGTADPGADKLLNSCLGFVCLKEMVGCRL